MTYLLGQYNNNILHISDYDPHVHKNMVKCRCCCTPLIAKKGKIKAHHYAHVNSDCSIKRDGDNKTPWHLLFQDIARSEHLERIIKKGDIRHIADVVNTQNTVIEIQHSNLPEQTILDRERFYDDMIWIMDGSCCIKNDNLTTYVSTLFTTTDGLYSVIHTTKRFWEVCTKKMYIDNGNGKYLLEVLKRLNGGNYLCKHICYEFFLNKYYNDILKKNISDTVLIIEEYHKTKNEKFESEHKTSLLDAHHIKNLKYDEVKNEFFGFGTYEIKKMLHDFEYCYDHTQKVWKQMKIHNKYKHISKLTEIENVHMSIERLNVFTQKSICAI